MEKMRLQKTKATKTFPYPSAPSLISFRWKSAIVIDISESAAINAPTYKVMTSWLKWYNAKQPKAIVLRIWLSTKAVFLSMFICLE